MSWHVSGRLSSAAAMSRRWPTPSEFWVTSRARILDALSHAELCVCDLATLLD
jgi:DNA-binding transcriptional ArsR family regulator